MTASIGGFPPPLQDPFAGSSSDLLGYAQTSSEATIDAGILSNVGSGVDSATISSAGLALAALSPDLNQMVANSSSLAQLGNAAGAAVQSAQGGAQAQLDLGVLAGMTDPAMPSSGITSLYQAEEVGSILDGLQGISLTA
ncbi:MAG: hypothetical protein KGR26_08795 [Cyanobacteria bacterium REEB65]|nr:hypothetical protein [Cyanobacteria bacterium REEB65]